jgi:hypothetical protein
MASCYRGDAVMEFLQVNMALQKRHEHGPST